MFEEPTTLSRTNKRTPQRRRARRKSWTRERRERFLSELAETSNVTAAARAADMCPQAAYKLRDRDAGFYRAWIGALTEGYERLELALLERALHGLEVDVWYHGKKVGKDRKYSDTVALTLYRAHRETVKGAPEAEDSETIKARIAAKLSLMNRRLGGNG